MKPKMFEKKDTILLWLGILFLIGTIIQSAIPEKNAVHIEPEPDIIIQGIPGGGGGSPIEKEKQEQLETICPLRHWNPNQTTKNPYVQEWQQKLEANITFATQIHDHCNGALACYSLTNGNITVNAYKVDRMPQTWATLHELTHKLWHEKMTVPEQKMWIENWNKTDTITPYAGTSESEDWAESVAAYYHEKKHYCEKKYLKEQQVYMIEKILKKYELPQTEE